MRPNLLVEEETIAVFDTQHISSNTRSKAQPKLSHFDTVDPFAVNQHNALQLTNDAEDNDSGSDWEDNSPSLASPEVVRLSSVATSRKSLSRKLPPALTESLELLASFSVSGSPRPSETGTIITTIVPSPNPQELSVTMPLVPRKTSKDYTEARKFTLEVAPPVNEEAAVTTPPYRNVTVSSRLGQPYKGHKKSPSGSSLTPRIASITSFASIRSSRTTSSVASTSLVTPSSSLRSYPRQSGDHSDSSNSCGIHRPGGSESVCGPWSGSEELFDEAGPSTNSKESRAERKARKALEAQVFNVDIAPSLRELYDASLLDVIDEHGDRVKFGDLVRGKKTIVVFIRHWFCPLCAQYVESINREVTQEALDEAGVDLIVIGNGSKKMLPAYKNKALKCPFKMYTDPTLQLYRALGLTRQTGDAGLDAEAGDYLIQSALEATVATIKRATVMPIRNPGHFTQLGGEFIFEGTLNVSYTHRMINTRAHAPIRDVCAQAGVRLKWVHYEPGPSAPSLHRASTISPLDELEALDALNEEDETAEGDDVDSTAADTLQTPSPRHTFEGRRTSQSSWKTERDEEIERIHKKKEDRRSKRHGGVWDVQAPRHADISGEAAEEDETLAVRIGQIGVAN